MTVHFFNSRDKSFNLFSITAVVITSFNVRSERFEISMLKMHTELSEEFLFLVSFQLTQHICSLRQALLAKKYETSQQLF